MAAMIPVYFYSPGACSLGGQVVLEWLQQPYFLCRVEREVRTSPAYLKINPRHKVPALKVGEQVIVENAAILTYLAERRPELNLLPAAGSMARIACLEWQSYLASGFHAAFSPYFAPGRYIADPAQHDAVKQQAIAQLRDQYAFVDQALDGKDYLLGTHKTVLDPYFYGLARWGKKLFDIPADYPNVARHMARMEADPAVQFAIATEKGQAAASPSDQFRGNLDLDGVDEV